MPFFKLKGNEDFPPAEWDADAIKSHSVYCPLNPGHQRSSGRLNELTIILKSPRIGDIIWTWLSECIVTERIAELFDKERVTGFELFPVRVSRILHGDRDLSHLPRLWELQLRGWGGVASPESGIHLVESCEGCGQLYYSSFKDPSRLIDIDQWDGSDIFMVWPLPRYIFVTDRVRILVEKAGLKGCTFVPVESLPTSKERGIIEGILPGRLRMWFPEARARELGEPLGIY